MLFNFNLTPLEQIRPWGAESGNTNLHWFGLTDGACWIQIGDVALFEYTDAAREAFGCAQYCDYYVVRLYEDLTEILPHILEPVPERLTPYIAGSGAAQWKDTLASWRDGRDVMRDDESFELCDAATSWFSQRVLNSEHLNSGPRIRLWSDAESVHIEWDNRERLIDDKPVWTALQGSARLSREEFVREAHAFHDVLMSQMGERVERVLAGALPPGINIDMDGLRRDHATRSRTLERALRDPIVPTDWDRAWSAVNEIAQGASPT